MAKKQEVFKINVVVATEAEGRWSKGVSGIWTECTLIIDKHPGSEARKFIENKFNAGEVLSIKKC